MSFIDDCERNLSLFVAVNGRQPRDGEEFAEWCEFVKNNSQTMNNRRDITKLNNHELNTHE